jgi:uncharacterized protein YjiK
VLFSQGTGTITMDMILDQTGAWSSMLGNNPSATESLGRTTTGAFEVFKIRTLGAPNPAASWARSAIVINEVTNQGSLDDACVGADWVELYNMMPSATSIKGMAIDDSSSSPTLGQITDLPAEVVAGKALILGQGTCPKTIPGGGYLVLCKGDKAFLFDAAGKQISAHSSGCGFGFGNGGSDEVVLFSQGTGNITMDMILDQTGAWSSMLGNNPSAIESLGRNWNDRGKFMVMKNRTLGKANPLYGNMSSKGGPVKRETLPCPGIAVTPPQLGKAPAALNLSAYSFVQLWSLTDTQGNAISEDLSGVAIIPGGNGAEDSILFCNNNVLLSDLPSTHLRIFEYSLPRTGSPPALLRSIAMDGFDDIEGLTLISSNNTHAQLAVTEEGRMNVVLFTIAKVSGSKPVSETVLHSKADAIYQITVGLDALGSNRGLEGVAYDPKGFLYTLTEENPMRVIRINMKTCAQDIVFSGTKPESYDSSSEFALLKGVATDIAGMTFDAARNSLVFLSHEGINNGATGPATVFTTDLQGKLISGPLSLQGKQPEGVVFQDDVHMYVIGEPNEVQLYMNTAAPENTAAPNVVTKVQQVFTFAGLNYTALTDQLKKDVIAQVKAALLSSLTGYTEAAIEVILSSGSVVATALVTPKSGETATKLSAAMTTAQTTVETAVTKNVQGITGINAALASGTKNVAALAAVAGSPTMKVFTVPPTTTAPTTSQATSQWNQLALEFMLLLVSVNAFLL